MKEGSVDDDDSKTVRERLVAVAKNHQEPKDRLWAVVIVLIFLTLIVGGIAFISWRSSETGNELTRTGQAIGFQRGAVDCLTTVVDSDRVFSIPDYCKRVEVMQWYPPEVCKQYFLVNPMCGSKWGTG